MNSANRYVVDCNRLWKGGKIMSEVDIGVVLASDYDTLRSSHSDLLEALQGLLASYEGMMHNEFDFPNDPWSAEGRNDDEALNAKKAIAKALASNN